MKFKTAIDILGKELIAFSGKIVARKMIELSDDDEAKKVLRANDFMERLFKGEAKKSELDVTDTQEWEEATRLAEAIRILEKSE